MNKKKVYTNFLHIIVFLLCVIYSFLYKYKCIISLLDFEFQLLS